MPAQHLVSTTLGRSQYLTLTASELFFVGHHINRIKRSEEHKTRVRRGQFAEQGMQLAKTKVVEVSLVTLEDSPRGQESTIGLVGAATPQMWQKKVPGSPSEH